jgi:Protein of unknown function (DUF3662)/FHA domain
MGILREFEQRLEGAVEGLFARAFKSGVQPVELGKRLVRAVEDGRTVGVSRVYVPNVYTYELSPLDRERFADYEDALGNELAALAVQTARDNNWAMLGPARIEFETDEGLSEGRFRVTGRVEPDASRGAGQGGRGDGAAGVPVGPHTAMLPGQAQATPNRVRAPASLVLMSGPHEVRTYPLNALQVAIGRSERSDIALADPGVSRNHARIVREGDDFIIEDLQSTNGTEVNGQPVRRRRLANGDMVKLANSTLQFRRER